jgi:hypothetical protein
VHLSRQQAVRIRQTLAHPMRKPLTEPSGSLKVPREIFGYQGKCLQPIDQTPHNGTLLEMRSCNGSAGQKWKFTTAGAVRHDASGLCLRDQAGARPSLGTCSTSAAQKWLRALDGNLIGNSGRCADVEGASQAEGAAVLSWPCPAGGSENQKWWSFYPEVSSNGGSPN